jgi:DNA topoisomerase-6 subunit B
MPHAPLVILVHLASVWAPYTSEAKEAIASYPEILKEIRLGLQACGRRLAEHLRHAARVREEFDKRTHLEKYLPHIGLALQHMLDLSDDERERIVDGLNNVLQEKRSV